MLRRVTFASCYVYSPRGTGHVSDRSRVLRELLKEGDRRFLLQYALRVRQQMAENTPLGRYLGPQHVLVPVPGCRLGASTCVAEQMAQALIAAGLGKDIWTGLRRAAPVAKSATASRGKRPTVANHYASFAVESAVPAPAAVVLVDDVITKGRTLLAAAARLKQAYPDIEVRAFALLRTLGFAENVERLCQPCRGEIRWRAGDAERVP